MTVWVWGSNGVDRGAHPSFIISLIRAVWFCYKDGNLFLIKMSLDEYINKGV